MAITSRSTSGGRVLAGLNCFVRCMLRVCAAGWAWPFLLFIFFRQIGNSLLFKIWEVHLCGDQVTGRVEYRVFFIMGIYSIRRMPSLCVAGWWS